MLSSDIVSDPSSRVTCIRLHDVFLSDKWNRGRFHVPRGVGQRFALGVTLDRNQTGTGFWAVGKSPVKGSDGSAIWRG